MKLERFIRSIPDFPRRGILFRDITPLLQNPLAFSRAVELLSSPYRKEKIDKVVSPEARGFILGGVLALELKAGFVPARKPGKLPYKTLRETYLLEYGEDALEIHEDALRKGERVLIFDDLLATGGTAEALCRLVEKKGGEIVGICFLIELGELKGRERLKRWPIFSLIKF